MHYVGKFTGSETVETNGVITTFTAIKITSKEVLHVCLYISFYISPAAWGWVSLYAVVSLQSSFAQTESVGK